MSPVGRRGIMSFFAYILYRIIDLGFGIYLVGSICCTFLLLSKGISEVFAAIICRFRQIGGSAFLFLEGTSLKQCRKCLTEASYKRKRFLSQGNLICVVYTPT